MLLSIAAFLVVIGVLVTIHELGHFLAAKWVGIQVPRFSIGLGPRVWGFRRGETEYVISAIPLGGYVKMAGMEDDEAAEALEGGAAAPQDEIDPERTFDSKPIWARTLVIIAGVVMNWLFAIFAFTLLAAIWGDPVDPSTRLAPDPTVAPSAAAEAGKVPFGAKVLAVGDKPVTSHDDIQMALLDAPAGPVALRLEGAQPVTLTLPEGEERRIELIASLPAFHEPILGQVVAGEPASRAGLQPGDRIVAANGRPVRSWTEAVKVIRASPGKPLKLDLVRGGRPLSVTVTPDTERETDAEGKTVPVGKVGAGGQIETQYRKVGVIDAIGRGFERTWATTELIVTTLGKLVTGEISGRSMGGLLTIGQASGESARLGMPYFLGFLALFSVNLAVLNLLPIPILDGGHLMFLAIEAVRGRPLSVEARIRFSQVGLIIVVGLMLWANGNDVVRLVESYFGG